MPNPNPPCSPTVTFIGVEPDGPGEKLRFHVDNPGCATSSGLFYYAVQFTDGSWNARVQAESWSAGDSGESFDYAFDSGATRKVRSVTVDSASIVCSCLDNPPA